MKYHIQRIFTVLFFIATAHLALAPTASARDRGPQWVPSHRYGPTVLTVVQEDWDGYDSYDGYFWMYHGFKWTDQEISNFMADPVLDNKDHVAVYEFRRVEDWKKTEGSPLSDHWDGAWGRNEKRCILFILCTNVQTVYTEYVSSLPSTHNKGLEEDDAWFSQRHATTIGPPAWSFDWCDIVEKKATGTDCDEEYEVSFDPNQLVANRHYYVALKFRTDSDDGTKPTKWRSEFEVHKPGSWFGIVPYYKNVYGCVSDLGEWEIDLIGGDTNETDFDLSNVNEVERCYFDYDIDGWLDHEDNCPRKYNPDQADEDSDGIGDVCDEKPTIHAHDIDADGQVKDNCPEVPNPAQEDADDDGIGNACDDDDDDDGVLDVQDAFPLNPGEWIDTDSDGIGDNTDTDDDGDGYADDVELDAGTDPLNPFSFPPEDNEDPNPDEEDDDGDGVPNGDDAFPFDPAESVDTDNDGIGNNADTDDDNDCYSDSVENSLGSDPLNPSSKPADNDSDCNPNALDPDDDNDGVPDANDAFPFDPAESVDTDNDGIGNNADADDDGDGMPDVWEIQYGLNPLDAGDAALDPDEDGDNNLAEFMNDTDPTDFCSPPQVSICYDFYGDGDLGQCGGTTGVNCVPLDEWTPSMLIQTDGRAGGCWQRFKLASGCDVDLVLCMDFQGGPEADLNQCVNHGVHCAGINQWTDAIRFDMDGRYGWCTQKFDIVSQDQYTLFMDFWASEGQDSSGQCMNVGTSKAFTKYETPTATIGLDTDDRPGGCWQRFMLKRGTWSIQAF